MAKESEIKLISIYEINGSYIVAKDEIEAISIFKEYHEQENPDRCVPDIKYMRRLEPHENYYALIKQWKPGGEQAEVLENQKAAEQIDTKDIDSLSAWPKEIVDELIEETQKNTPKVKEGLRKYFSNILPYLCDINIDKMAEEYYYSLDPAYSEQINSIRVASYRKGLEDMLKRIKEGGKV